MNELILRTKCYLTTQVGTQVTRKSTKNEWENYGEILRRVDEAKQWAIGDWLVDGKRHYGDGLYKRAAEITGLGSQALENYAWLARLFEISTRVETLGWTHHREVASIKQIAAKKNGKLYLSDKPDHNKIAELLDQAEKHKWSVVQLRDMVRVYKRRQDEEIRLANEPEKYPVILADPAWEYDFAQSSTRKIDNQYLPTSLSDMQRLKPPSADNCVMFMWATNPKLREAFELIDAWGFTYKTNMAWVKDKIGMGYYARQKHELVLIATKGNIQLPAENKRPESVFCAARAKHSEKPEIIYELIEQMYPEYKKYEMFARSKRDGWDAWGDEIS